MQEIMKEEEKFIQSLHPYERAVLPVLTDGISLASLVEKTKLQEVEVMRGLQWLESKNVLRINKKVTEIIHLDTNGKIYLEKGLPEKRFLEVLERPLRLEEIKEKAALDANEFNVCLGSLKSKGCIAINKGIAITEQGRERLVKLLFYQQFLKKLPVTVASLQDDEKEIYHELKARKEIINIEEEKTITISLTDLGRKLSKIEVIEHLIDQVTPTLLREGSWNNKKFRRYDVTFQVPRVYGGKRHFVHQALQYMKRIWLDLGFQEMTGDYIQPSFWNFDALFTPQDHPAREMQDTFFVAGKGKIEDKQLMEKVKKTHEDGWKTGSKGWQYQWNEQAAQSLVLRTHTTVLSAQTLARLQQQGIPGKYFAIGKVFRNEVLDWSHLFEFHQAEGIVVSEDVTFRDLLGYLKEFFQKMGFEKIRFRPAYFPYTNFSTEVEVFHPVHKKWIELGGAGMFRSEVVIPLLGKDIPVLAWGLGLERILVDYYGITDLREIYSNDLKKLREMKVWLK